MKVLQLCHKPPYPPIDGGCIAINNISMGLIQEGVDLKLLTISTHKHPFNPGKIPKEWMKSTKAQGVFVDTKLNIVDAFSSLVTNDSYNISRFFSADFDILIANILAEEEFDVIHLESLFMTPYIHTIKRLSNAKIILRSHNLEYMIWQRMATASTQKMKKMYLQHLARQLKEYELDKITQVDGIASISPRDAIHYADLGCNVPIVTIPFGLNLEEYIPSERPSSSIGLFHLGAMDWMPNIEGVDWFFKKIWGNILKSFPEIQFYLAGKSSDAYRAPKKPKNIHYLGEVPDAKEFINNHDVMIVPLLSGGGIRIKIIEGMALGKTIISTSIGAEGIVYQDGVNILIADTPEEMLKAITTLIEDPNLIKTIGEAARKNVERNYDNNVLSKKLISFYNSI